MGFSALLFFFSSRRRHTRYWRDWSSDVCSSDLDWLTRYRAGIDAVTPAEVRAVAARYLHPEQFAILVVGPAKGTDKPLTTFGKVTPLDISIPPPPARRPAGR